MAPQCLIGIRLIRGELNWATVLFIVYCSRIRHFIACNPSRLRSHVLHLAARVHALPPWPPSFLTSNPTSHSPISDIIPTLHFLTPIPRGGPVHWNDRRMCQYGCGRLLLRGGHMDNICNLGSFQRFDFDMRQVNRSLTSYFATAVGMWRNIASPHMENVASMGRPAHRECPTCLDPSLAFTLSALYNGRGGG